MEKRFQQVRRRVDERAGKLFCTHVMSALILESRCLADGAAKRRRRLSLCPARYREV